MLFVSDVHGAAGPLRRLVRLGEPVVVLGDLVNLTDYRNGQGAVADVLDAEVADATAKARAAGDYEGMRQLWRDHSGVDIGTLRSQIESALDLQYQEVSAALSGGTGLVIHGNVDRPEKVKASLPEGFKYVHGDVVELDGLSLGLVGGGTSTPMAVPGEVSDEEMMSMLDELGPVDVLCTHVPPAIDVLRRDVITGREERGSGPIRDYLQRHQPRFHFFGDVHQAQATAWRVGSTRCFNAGYFRATGRYLRLESAMVQAARLH